MIPSTTDAIIRKSIAQFISNYSVAFDDRERQSTDRTALEFITGVVSLEYDRTQE